MTTATSVPDGRAHQTALFMIQAFMSSRLLGIAAKLGLADVLASGPRTAACLARAFQLEEAITIRLLRGFASCGLIRQSDDDMFTLTAVGAYLRTGETSLRDLAIRTYDLDYVAWGVFLDALKANCTPFDYAFGSSFYPYLASRPAEYAAFNHAMTAMTASIVPDLISSYDFGRARVLVDVGGGQGTLLKALLQYYPDVNGILFDTQPAVDGALADLEPTTASRLTVADGDFLKAVPPGGDIYILKLVLHNWPDHAATTILRKCRQAIADTDASLLIIERIMPECLTPESAHVVASDLTMLTLFGGMERTANHYRSLLADAGFSLTNISHTSSPFSLLQAVPQ